MQNRVKAPRILSAILFLGGAIMLWLFHRDGSPFENATLNFFYVMIPGYLIWLLWGVRVIVDLPVWLRRCMWIGSVVWHGWWTVVILYFIGFTLLIPHWGIRMSYLWLPFALVMSFILIGLDVYQNKSNKSAHTNPLPAE